MRSRYRHPVVRKLGNSHRNTYQCRDDDSDEQGALHSSRHQTTAEQDADETQDADWRKLAELHESISIGSNDAGILQTDKGDKHTNTCRNGESEVLRNTLQYLIADIEEGDGQEDKCLKKQLLVPLSALLMYFPASAFSPYLFLAQKSFFEKKYQSIII